MRRYGVRKNLSESVMDENSMSLKNVRHRLPAEDQKSCERIVNGICLDSLRADKAAELLSVPLDRFKNLVTPNRREAGSSKRPTYDIRLLFSLQGQHGDGGADCFEAALAQKQLELLTSADNPSAADLRAYLFDEVSDLFRDCGGFLPRFRKLSAAQEILRSMLVIESGRHGSKPEPFVFNRIIAYKGGRAVGNDKLWDPAIRVCVNSEKFPKGKKLEDFAARLKAGDSLDKLAENKFISLFRTGVYRPEIVDCEPPPGLGYELERRYEQDEEMQAWFDPKRIGWPYTEERFFGMLSYRAGEVFEAADWVSLPAKLAMIALFGDPVAFMEQFGVYHKPADPHEAIPKIYAVNDKAWNEWARADRAVIYRNRSWLRQIPAGEAAGIFGYRVARFSIGNKRKWYAQKTDGSWMPPDELRVLESRLTALGIDVETGFLKVAGKPMRPEKLFKAVMPGKIENPPPDVIQARKQRDEKAAQRKAKNRERNLKRQASRKKNSGSV